MILPEAVKVLLVLYLFVNFLRYAYLIISAEMENDVLDLQATATLAESNYVWSL